MEKEIVEKYVEDMILKSYHNICNYYNIDRKMAEKYIKSWCNFGANDKKNS